MWRTSGGDFRVVIKDGILSASGEVKNRVGAGAFSALLGLDLATGPAEIVVTVRYEGRLHGMAIMYSRWQENGGENSKVTGLMYLTDDLATLHLYENGPGSSGSFSEMVRI